MLIDMQASFFNVCFDYMLNVDMQPLLFEDVIRLIHSFNLKNIIWKQESNELGMIFYLSHSLEKKYVIWSAPTL